VWKYESVIVKSALSPIWSESSVISVRTKANEFFPLQKLGLRVVCERLVAVPQPTVPSDIPVKRASLKLVGPQPDPDGPAGPSSTGGWSVCPKDRAGRRRRKPAAKSLERERRDSLLETIMDNTPSW
jgi:hypothetical protein